MTVSFFVINGFIKLFIFTVIGYSLSSAMIKTMLWNQRDLCSKVVFYCYTNFILDLKIAATFLGEITLLSFGT